jgi:hypothetical protein
VISALSSLETGQPALALAVSVSKVAWSAPGILAFKARCTSVMAKPPSTCSIATFAVVSISVAVSLASPRMSERAMVKQAAWAAAISSSGLLPRCPSKRLAKP